MTTKLECILLVDDDSDDNFIHERAINKNDTETIVIAKQTGMDALEYLRSKNNTDGTHPDLIFVDINMPGMNGWEFLDEYKKLDKQLQSHAIVVMLTTSGNPDDKVKAKLSNVVSDFITKPLTQEILEGIIARYFN